MADDERVPGTVFTQQELHNLESYAARDQLNRPSPSVSYGMSDGAGSGGAGVAPRSFGPNEIAAGQKTRFGIGLGILIGILWGFSAGGVINFILGIVIATALCAVAASRGLLGAFAGGVIGLIAGSQTHKAAKGDLTDLFWGAVIGVIVGLIVERIVTGIMVRRIKRAS